MEFNNVKRSELFPNMTVVADNLIIPIADLVQQNVSTGQEIAFSLIATLWQRWVNSPLATATKSNPQGIGVDRVRLNYSFAFSTVYDPTKTSMVAESISPVTSGVALSNNNQISNNNQLSN